MGNRFFAIRLRVLLITFLFAHAELFRASAQPFTNLSVMSFNVLVSGQRGLSNIAEAIRRAGADVVGLQEIAGSPAAIRQLATNLGFHTLPGLSVISRYPLLGPAVPGTSEVQNGATVELSPGQRVHVFN